MFLYGGRDLQNKLTNKKMDGSDFADKVSFKSYRIRRVPVSHWSFSTSYNVNYN